MKLTNCWSFVKDDFQLVGVTYLCKFLDGKEKLSDEHDGFVWEGVQEVLDGDYPDWLKEEVLAANN